MIKVTKLNGEAFYVSPYEIEFIEETPDTVISLKSGKKVLVSENAELVIERMVNFYRLVNQEVKDPLAKEPPEEELPEEELPEEKPEKE